MSQWGLRATAPQDTSTWYNLGAFSLRECRCEVLLEGAFQHVNSYGKACKGDNHSSGTLPHWWQGLALQLTLLSIKSQHIHTRILCKAILFN